MEDSFHSQMNKSFASRGKTNETQEESGWTGYFEDFLSNQILEQNSSSNSDDHSFGSPSLVSDAASYFPWKSSNINEVVDGSPKFPKKLNFKQTRTKEISYDDSLEDTASSPVNSPKVSYFKQMADMNPRKRDDIFESSLGKGGGYDKYSEEQINVRKERNFFENNNIDSTDLKKRGLCLVPLSMLVNYVG